MPEYLIEPDFHNQGLAFYGAFHQIPPTRWPWSFEPRLAIFGEGLLVDISRPLSNNAMQ